jgi:CubicO group peptidase (beta-lactamase class C family)
MLTEPGNFFNYSNPNFALAGLVAEEAADQPYSDLMRAKVWDPLCMLRTSLEAEDVLADGNFAAARSTFNADGEQRIEPGTYDSGFSRPAGFAWTSAMDMVRFADFLLEGNSEVMPAAQSSSITAAQVDMLGVPGGLQSYGYGIEVVERYDSPAGMRQGPLLKHGGAIPGYAADLYVHEPSGVAVAILANSDGAYFGNSALTVIEELGMPATADPIDLGLPMDLSEFVGTYSDPDNVGDITFTVVDGELILDAPRLDEVSVPYNEVMAPRAADNFIFDAQNSPLPATFIRGPDGQPKWLRTRAFVAERVDL